MAGQNGVVTKKYLDDRLDAFKKELVGIKVEIVKEIRDMREEFDAHRFSHMRIDKDLIEHGKKLAGLKK